MNAVGKSGKSIQKLYSSKSNTLNNYLSKSKEVLDKKLLK